GPNLTAPARGHRTTPRPSGRRRQVRIVVGVALGALALLQLAPQIGGLVGAAPMTIRVGVGAGLGDLLALSALLLALAPAQLLSRRIVAAHCGKDRPDMPPPTASPVRYRARVISGRLVCAAAMIAAIALAGCGSGKSSSSTSKVDFKTGFATSQREFRKLGSDLAKDIIGAR